MHSGDPAPSKPSAAGVPGLPLPLSGRTELYGIIGDPIAQAGSPIVFNTAFRNAGMQAVLVPLHVSAAGLMPFVTGAKRIGNLRGLIITKPHKTAIVACVNEICPNARRSRSVNAIRCAPDGIWVGDNFDGVGCITGLLAARHDLRGRRVLIIGTGGAGRAVAFAAANAGVAGLGLFDINEQEVLHVSRELKRSNSSIPCQTGSSDPSGFDVIINCTHLGMVHSDPLPIDPAKLRPGSLVVDLVVEPEMTPLLRAAVERSCSIHTGKNTLSGQVGAVLAFFQEGK